MGATVSHDSTGQTALTLTPQWKLEVNAKNAVSNGYTTLHEMTFDEPAKEIHANVTYCVETLLVPGEMALMVDNVVEARCVAPLGASSGALSAGVIVEPGAHSVKILWKAGTLGTIQCHPEDEPHHVALSVLTTNV